VRRDPQRQEIAGRDEPTDVGGRQAEMISGLSLGEESDDWCADITFHGASLRGCNGTGQYPKVSAPDAGGVSRATIEGS
jgi:hypothetical protein